MYLYKSEMYDKFKFKFDRLENISQNYSQCFQDLFVLAALNGKMHGTFLEIGAYDGSFISNTKLLESEFGWSGVSVDCDPGSAYSFREQGRKAKFILSDALKVDYKELLKPFGDRLDYLSLDIEPNINTLNCLKILPLDTVKFNVVTFETDVYSLETSAEYNNSLRQQSRDILQSHGYVMVAGNISNLDDTHPFEDWYVSGDFGDDIINKFKRGTDKPIASHVYMLGET